MALKNLRLVVAGRLLRKLLRGVQGRIYARPGAQLKKLNMNPESVSTLYLARKEPMHDTKGNPVPCNFCKDLAFKGRVGVYEVLLVDDEMKKALEANSENQIKQVFRKQHGRLLQEVAAGAKCRRGIRALRRFCACSRGQRIIIGRFFVGRRTRRAGSQRPGGIEAPFVVSGAWDQTGGGLNRS